MTNQSTTTEAALEPCPRWTVTYNIVSPESNAWVGTGWEFFNNEKDADNCYKRHRNLGNVPTKRPFYSSVDWQHLGVTDRARIPAPSLAPEVDDQSDAALFRALSTVVYRHCKDAQLPRGIHGLIDDLSAWVRSTFAWSFEGEKVMNQHAADCAWERITNAECSYRDTHYYCPHPEHACTCLPRTKPLNQHLSERMNTANNVLGLLLAASRDEGGAGMQSCVQTLIEIATERERAGTLYSEPLAPIAAAPASPVALRDEAETTVKDGFTKHLMRRHEELALHVRQECAKVIELIEQYTRPDFYAWLVMDYAGQKSDPYKRAAEAKAILQGLINGKPNERSIATTPPSTLAKSAAEEIQDWNERGDTNGNHEADVAHIQAIIERCLSGGGGGVKLD